MILPRCACSQAAGRRGGGGGSGGQRGQASPGGAPLGWDSSFLPFTMTSLPPGSAAPGAKGNSRPDGGHFLRSGPSHTRCPQPSARARRALSPLGAQAGGALQGRRPPHPGSGGRVHGGGVAPVSPGKRRRQPAGEQGGETRTLAPSRGGGAGSEGIREGPRPEGDSPPDLAPQTRPLPVPVPVPTPRPRTRSPGRVGSGPGRSREGSYRSRRRCGRSRAAGGAGPGL